MTDITVILSTHALERGWDRFALNRTEAEALATRVVAKGRRIGPASSDATLTWVRHKRAIGLVQFAGRRAVVVSLMPGNWRLDVGPNGGYYAKRPLGVA
jgi:hypothetical protein